MDEEIEDCQDCGDQCARVNDGAHECPDDLAAADFEERAYGRPD